MPRSRKQVDDLAAEQRRTSRLRLRRKVLIILFGVVALSAIAGGTTWFEPDTLVKQTVVMGDATYVCRIKKVKGELHAEWSRQKFLWWTGEADSLPLGLVDRIGTNEPKIAVDSTNSRIAFEVGGTKSIIRPGR